MITNSYPNSLLQITIMYKKDVDMILGSTWMQTLGTFILNMKKKFLTLPYKEITLQDFTMKPCLEAPSLEALKDIDVILLDNKNSLQKMQKKLDKVVKNHERWLENDEVFFFFFVCLCVKNHSQSLITQIKKLTSEKSRYRKI